MRSALLPGMTLIVISLLFLAFNLVWIKHIPDIRWDASQQKVHTLSLPARQLLATLESPLDLYYFNSRNDPRRSQVLNRYGERVEDLLKQYEKAAKGMLNLHIIDPAPYSEDAYKAALYGLDDQHGFLGLIGARAGIGTQRISAFNPDHEALLEYEIGHLIHTLTRSEPPTVGVLSGFKLQTAAGQLLEQMQKHFKLVELSPTTGQIPSSVETMMVVHPRLLPERALYAIEQFVLRGGKLMIFVDPLSETTPSPAPADSALDGILAAWGLQMPSEQMLIDNVFASSTLSGPGTTTVQQAARLNVLRQGMNTHDISSWNLSSVTVSSSGALSLIRKSHTTLTPLLQSSRRSIMLDTRRFAATLALESLNDANAPMQSHVIAARIEGPAYSAFPDGIKGLPAGLQDATRIQVTVIADTDMLTDTVVSSTGNSNVRFVLNTLDNLAAPAALANIRPRAMNSPTPHLLEQMREVAAQSYSRNAGELERRFARTEQAWQQLSPRNTGVVTQAVDTSVQLQALNKERLRLPIEMHALKVEAYAKVLRLKRELVLLMVLAIPLPLCLIAWVLALRQRRRRSAHAAAAY
ncbi:Gldg family protein [Pseudomonas sp. GNP013]